MYRYFTHPTNNKFFTNPGHPHPKLSPVRQIQLVSLSMAARATCTVRREFAESTGALTSSQPRLLMTHVHFIAWPWRLVRRPDGWRGIGREGAWDGVGNKPLRGESSSKVVIFSSQHVRRVSSGTGVGVGREADCDWHMCVICHTRTDGLGAMLQIVDACCERHCRTFQVVVIWRWPLLFKPTRWVTASSPSAFRKYNQLFLDKKMLRKGVLHFLHYSFAIMGHRFFQKRRLRVGTRIGSLVQESLRRCKMAQ